MVIWCVNTLPLLIEYTSHFRRFCTKFITFCRTLPSTPRTSTKKPTKTKLRSLRNQFTGGPGSPLVSEREGGVTQVAERSEDRGRDGHEPGTFFFCGPFCSSIYRSRIVGEWRGQGGRSRGRTGGRDGTV